MAVIARGCDENLKLRPLQRIEGTNSYHPLCRNTTYQITDVAAKSYYTEGKSIFQYNLKLLALTSAPYIDQIDPVISTLPEFVTLSTFAINLEMQLQLERGIKCRVLFADEFLDYVPFADKETAWVPPCFRTKFGLSYACSWSRNI
jgi:hypothetical protein